MRGSKLIRLMWFGLLRSGEAGSALVETALTMPILIAMLLGAVELGDFAYKSSQVTSAARAAVQYATMNGGAFTDCNNTRAGGACNATSGVVKAAKNDAPWVVSKCSSLTVSVTSSCVCSTGGACDAVYACTAGKPKITVTAQTTAQCAAAASVPHLFSSNLFTFHGYAQQLVLP